MSWKQCIEWRGRLSWSLLYCWAPRAPGDLFPRLLHPPNCISRALTTPSTLSHKEPLPCSYGARFSSPYPGTGDVGLVMLLSTISAPSLMPCYRRPWLCVVIEAFIEGDHQEPLTVACGCRSSVRGQGWLTLHHRHCYRLLTSG
jgi:hypothetical protein